MRDLWRVALWGFAATAALTVAVYAASTEIAQDRAKFAFAEIHEMLLSSGVKPARPLSAQEGRRLAETVRVLAADRERLIGRIATLEHSMDDITGSIAKVQKAQQEAQRPPEPAPQPQAEGPTPAQEEDVTSSISPPAEVAPPAGKTQFGLDLGNATTVEALRTAWAVALRKHASLLEGLHPVVHARERRPGSVELRLIAGPLPNAATAARLCMSMTAAGAICQPAVFNGQRLAIR